MEPKKENRGMSYSRKSMKKPVELYNAYMIFYNDALGGREFAIVGEDSSEKAENALEKTLVETKGYDLLKGNLNTEVIDLYAKISIKGVIGFDRYSNSLL